MHRYYSITLVPDVWDKINRLILEKRIVSQLGWLYLHMGQKEKAMQD